MPARGLPKPPPTSPCQESTEFTCDGAQTRYADAVCGREIQSRNWDAERGGGGNSEKRRDTLTD